MDAKVGPIRLTEDEFVEISLHKARTFYGRRRGISLGLCLVFIVLAIGVLTTARQVQVQVLAVPTIMVSIVGMVTILGQDKKSGLVFRQFANNPLNGLVFEPKTYTFSEATLGALGASGATASYPWAAMARVSVWESYLMIHPTDLQWFAIPLKHVEPELLEFLLSRKTRSSIVI